MSEIRWIKRIPGYHYNDTPEDEDCLKKVIFMNKMGLFFGLALGTLDVVNLSKPVGFANIAGRYGVITAPILATGSAYAAATCLTANYRGKLDYVNSTVGGFVAGCTFGGVLRNGRLAFVSSLVLGSLAYGIGICKDLGIKYMEDPDEQQIMGFGGFWSIKYDFSLTEERPKGWNRAIE